MQYKKEAVREKILAAARKEYLARGFRGANVSAIAKNAGVPVGNLYRYFDGKTGLLDALVRPAHEALSRLLSELQKVEILDSFTLSQTMPILSGELLEFFDAFGDDILILMDCCDGTRYEDFFKELTTQVSRIVKRKLYAGECDEQEEQLAYIVSRAFCGSLLDVLRMGLNREQKQKTVERLLKYYFFEVDKRK